ncbi:MAG: PCMD domain-containing protein [Bacteroidaceae bacterium]|nr:PCMD domain-containing protein [Bacteroidaceae bacterium]
MMHLRDIRPFYLMGVILVVLSSCAIKDDLPLPVQKAMITAFEVEGQCDATGEGYAVATIDKETRTVDLYVDDRVDISHLRVKRMEVSFDADIAIENADAYFPEKSFYTSGSSCPVVDFSHEVDFVLTTYQVYRWKVRVHQVIKREVELENQVGVAVIDSVNRNVVVYVAPNQSLRSVKVNKMILGGVHGKISPDPTGLVLDFSMRRTFQVTYAWMNSPVSWDVYVYNADKSLSTTATVFPHANRAFVSGDMQNGTTPVVEYRQQGSAVWNTVPSNQIQIGTASYQAEITSLLPGTDYECQVTAGGVSSGVRSFRTAPNLQLENTSFDDWHVVGSGNQALYNPWAENGSCYWDTGNRGATTVGASNSTFGVDGGRTYANLQSKFIVIKFAAGNIFTGTYLKTDGSNGILSFGRPFTSFPTKLQFDYTYKSSTVNRGGGKWDDKYSRYISQQTYDEMRGKPDSCCVYIALFGDKDEEVFNGVTYPFIIRTKISELHLFNPNDENVIAYGQFTSGDDQTVWTTKTITLDYHYTDRTPKYIVVVCSSSKYGDYFIGGDTSLLKIDNLKLLYD